MGKYMQLSINERRRFYIFLEMGLSITEIAKRLTRHRSTLYRELDRNKESEGYFPVLADHKTKERLRHKRASKLETDGVLRDYIIRSLEKGWSPEQIAGRMKHKKLTFYACHETIYQFIYASKDQRLYGYLPYKRSRRSKRYARKKQTCRFGEIRLISQRPEDIATRKRFGHWEGDTIQFKGVKEKVVTTLVERKSRMVCLIKNESKHSRGVMEKIKERLKGMPQKMRQTITFDQGTEFADYRHIGQQIGCKIYYCQSHSPWQKGSNENMNGRIRWYLPKDTEITTVTQERLDQLAAKLNRCPRKCLGFKTPNEVFIQDYKNAWAQPQRRGHINQIRVI